MSSEPLVEPVPRGGRPIAGIAVAVLVLASSTIAGAWLFQFAGYPPCELCLKERIPYYAGIPLAGLVAVLARRARWGLAMSGFCALALIFGAGLVLASYHAGVEWGWWPGPASCTGSFAAPSEVGDFLHQLQTANVVRCDAAALRILGLSLTGWDAAICAVLACLAVIGAVRAGRINPASP